MKKTSPFLFTVCLIFNYSFAQTPGHWTWMHGDSASPSPVYGTKGIPSSANKPMALYEPVEWTDTAGNFWLYGGVSNVGPQPEQADLWQFNPLTNQWTWMKGPGNITTNQLPVWGTKGIGAPANTPGSRGWGAASWVDLNGDFWLFGGANYIGYFSDLWKYSISANEWTWMAGPKTYNNAGIYGTKGTAATGNNPGSRHELNAAWVDNAGNLWMFGGNGYDAVNQFRFLNDLWQFDAGSNQWAWMNGPVTGNNYGLYGIKGVANATNLPSGRWCYAKWKDLAGNLYMFGGHGLGYNYGIKSLGALNDLWKYDISADTWTWVSGTDSLYNGGRWDTSCNLSSVNTPSGRYENRTCWTDACGNFWMFGGHDINGMDKNNLWYYNPYLNQWGWTGNMTSPAEYGSKGVSSPSNQPVARGGGIGWVDKAGYLWMGEGWSIPATKYYNDLWRFVPDSACNHCNYIAAPPVASFHSSDSAVCAGECIDFTDLSAHSPVSWRWNFNGATPASSTLKNPAGVCYPDDGIYSVKLHISNNGGADSVIYINLITVHSVPPVPGISQSGDTLFTSVHSGYVSYQWYYNSFPISGATDTFYVAMQNGNYNIKVTNEFGCSVGTGINVVLTGMGRFTVYGLQFTVDPNPVSDVLELKGNWKNVTDNSRLSIFNVLGEKVSAISGITRSQYTFRVDVSLLVPGIYFLEIMNVNEKWVGRFIKE